MDIGSGYTTADEAALCSLLAKRTRLIHKLASFLEQKEARLQRLTEAAEALEATNIRQAERIQSLERQLADFKAQNERLQAEQTQGWPQRIQAGG